MSTSFTFALSCYALLDHASSKVTIDQAVLRTRHGIAKLRLFDTLPSNKPAEICGYENPHGVLLINSSIVVIAPDGIRIAPPALFLKSTTLPDVIFLKE